MATIDSTTPGPAGRPARRRAASWLPLLVILAAAAVVRLALADYSLWFDDLASIFYAAQPFDRLWSTWMVRETTPPLYYSILRVWMQAAGWSAPSLRLPSIVASLLAIVAIHIGMARNYGPKAAAIAALLLALSAQQLVFSHQVRAYILLFLTVSVSYMGLLEVLRPGGRQRAGWIAYVIGAAAGIYLHVTGALWPAAASLALIACERRFAPFRGVARWPLVAANGLVLLASAWWIAIMVLQHTRLEGIIGWIPDTDYASLPMLLRDSVLLTKDAAGWTTAAPLLIAALALAGVVRGWSDPRLRFTAFAFVIAFLLFVLVSIRQPIILDRTLLWLSIFPLVLASVHCAAASWRSLSGLALLACAILLGINLAATTRYLLREDWRLPVHEAARHPRAIVIVDGEAMGLTLAMACRAELARPCPFAVLPLIVRGKTFDLWGRGYGTTYAPRIAGWSDLGKADVFTFSRWGHDPLDEFHQRGRLQSLNNEPDSFVGPLPPHALDEIAGRYALTNGMILLPAAPVRP